MHLKRIHLSSVGSTNQYLSELLKSGRHREEVVVIADYQENGRGQGDHCWDSDPGENLTMSVLLFPAFLSASGQFHLSRVASLALCDTLKKLNLDPVIKWPNDILVNEKKIAGILIENGITGNKLSHSILGIGLNLNQQQFPSYPLAATSLGMEGHERLEPSEAARILLESLEVRYGQLASGSVDILELDYLENLYGLNLPLAFNSDGIQFRGVIRGVNDYGELIVERNGKREEFAFQQIGYSRLND